MNLDSHVVQNLCALGAAAAITLAIIFVDHAAAAQAGGAFVIACFAIVNRGNGGPPAAPGG